ncbi:MAG: dihydrolipoyl dehydrogenase family protein, partial [Acidimicrobiales bacterium]
YRAIPRVVYTDPPAAGVGVTADQARHQKIEIVTSTLEMSDTARAESDGRLLPDDKERSSDDLSASVGGLLILVADRERRVLIGASAIGPAADEWISEATLAIRAEIPLELLADTVHPFPTFAEAYEPVVRGLLSQLAK